jgi:hypothetical protein
VSHPIVSEAYGSNVYHALRLKQELEAAGVSWVYDPSVEAGRIASAVRGLGGLLFCACGWISVAFGIGVGSVANSVIVTISALVPLLGFVAGQTFQLGVAASVVCAGLCRPSGTSTHSCTGRGPAAGSHGRSLRSSG